VLAYTVAQRTREFGLRMALGAEPRGVLGLVMKRVAWMTLAGTAAGITLALYIGSVAESILFEMEANDPLALGGSALVLAVVALGAGFIPAWRASRVSPMRALRYE
jgi:ABC-type antimicrobial peptide transport system permease subunit